MTGNANRVGRSERAPLVVALLAGLIAGALAERGDTLSQWTSQLGSQGGLWLVAGVVIGVASPSSRSSIRNAMGFYGGVVGGYYGLTAATVGGASLHLVVFWLAMGVAGAPVLAWAGHDALHNGHRGSAIIALSAGGLLAEALHVGSIQVNLERWAPVVFDTSAAAAIGVWLAKSPTGTRRLIILAGLGIGLGWILLAFIRFAT